MKITATQDTYLKKGTGQASTLPEGKKTFVPKGKSFPVAQHLNTDGSHEHVRLDHSAGSWFVYVPHWDIELDKTEVYLDVPYLSQRDNKIRPSQTCNMTSAAMVVGFYYPERLKGPKQLEDVLTSQVVAEHGHSAIYYHNRIVEILGDYGVVSKFSTETGWDEIKEHLSSGNPVIYSGKFTKSGHIIVLTGYDESGFIVNDPWGEWFVSGYQAKSGKNLHYSYAMMERLSYGSEHGGWAHLCTKKSAKKKSPKKTSEDGDRRASDGLDGIDLGLIKKWEGLRLEAYLCPAGVPTIGYGNTFYPDGRKVKIGDKLKDGSEAIALLTETIKNDFLPSLRKIPCWGEMSTPQKSALASFAYNLGAGFYGSKGFSTITAALKNKHWGKVPSALGLYVKAGGKTLEGLVNRRAEEAALWRQG